MRSCRRTPRKRLRHQPISCETNREANQREANQIVAHDARSFLLTGKSNQKQHPFIPASESRIFPPNKDHQRMRGAISKPLRLDFQGHFVLSLLSSRRGGR
jgi:hypothetical protein